MQNVFNLKSPFLDPVSGNPLVGGRVFFVEPSNDNQTVLIHIFDKDGSELQNPQLLNDLGTFDTQPFVDDGLDYKMLVERATGLDDPAWELVYTMDSKSQKLNVEYSGAAVADTITALRTVNPEVGVCVVKGYSDAEDCCPSRIFKWTEDFLPENYGTHIHSTLPGFSAEGTWVCEPSGFLDVRWFGINSQRGDGSGNIFDALSRASQSHPNIPLYFPTCEFAYILGSSINLRCVIIDKGADIAPLENTVTIGIEWLENRGGRFCAKVENDAESIRVIPKIKGLLKTSWLKGTLSEFLTSEALNGLTEIDFDRIGNGGLEDVTIQKMIVHNRQNKPSNVSTSNCIEFDYNEGLIYINQLRFGRFLIKQNQGDIQFALAANPGSSMLDINTQGITTPKVQCTGGGTFGSGLSVTGSSSFFGSVGIEGNLAAAIISASSYFVGLLKGTMEGNVKPTSLTVEVKGGGSSGHTNNYDIDTVDKEEFVIAVDMDVALYDSDIHTIAAVIKDRNTTKEIVVSAVDRENRTGKFLVVCYREGENYFFSYDHERWFPYGSGVFARNKT